MSENTDKEGRWYVMQVMSGRENKVFSRLTFECSKDQANVVELPETENQRFHALYKGMSHGIYEVNIPCEYIEVREKDGKKKMKDGKPVTKDRKLYPGYVLVRARLTDDNGRALNENITYINGVDGVIGLLGGVPPVPLSPSEVETMNRFNEENGEDKVKPKVQFNVGESVVFKSGAFQGNEGIIESIDEERGKLKVSVNIFGRYTQLDVDFWQVERPND